MTPNFITISPKTIKKEHQHPLFSLLPKFDVICFSFLTHKYMQFSHNVKIKMSMFIFCKEKLLLEIQLEELAGNLC